MKKMNNKGFSLIELIIVIAIMAVLVAVIAPNLTGYIGKSKVNTDNSNADTIESAINTCLQDFTSDETIGAYATDVTDRTKYDTVDKIVVAAKATFNNADIKTPSGTSNKAKVTSAFEDNVKKALSKYVDNNRIVPKQDGFTFYIKIEGTYDAGYTCEVECAKDDPWNAAAGS